MTASVKHLKVSAIPDAGDPTLVEPSDWNADHVLTGVQGTVTLTTTGTSGAATFDGATLNVPNYAFADTGITQITGDVTAGPGSGSQAATVVAVNNVTFSGLATGILKNTTATGVPSIAVAGDFPTLNQNTTGSAAKWTTARNLAGNSVDGSAAVAFANKFLVQGTTDAGLSGAQFMGALGTGIVKNTTSTGVQSIAVAADFPTLNQNTTGSAAKLTTPRTIAGTSFDGSANVSLANKFIAQGTSDAGLSAAQFLGALATGIVKNTTTTGVLSVAAAGTDYVVPGGALGTPSSGVATNLTGTAAGLTAGNVTTNANLTGPVTSVGNATSIAPSIALPGSPTTTTQSANDNSTKIATTAYVDAKSSGSQVLLATITPAGSPATVTSANFVSTSYTSLVIVFDNVTFTGSNTLNINVSSDNASTFDTSILIIGNAATFSGNAMLTRVGVTADKIFSCDTNLSTPVSAGRFATKTAATTNIRLTATSFTGGNIYIYGVP